MVSDKICPILVPLRMLVRRRWIVWIAIILLAIGALIACRLGNCGLAANLVRLVLFSFGLSAALNWNYLLQGVLGTCTSAFADRNKKHREPQTW